MRHKVLQNHQHVCEFYHIKTSVCDNYDQCMYFISTHWVMVVQIMLLTFIIISLINLVCRFLSMLVKSIICPCFECPNCCCLLGSTAMLYSISENYEEREPFISQQQLYGSIEREYFDANPSCV